MSAMTQSGRRGLERIERLFDALADPARGERTVVAVLLGYVALWTLYGAIAKGSQDIHPDMSEQFALGRELADTGMRLQRHFLHHKRCVSALRPCSRCVPCVCSWCCCRC